MGMKRPRQDLPVGPGGDDKEPTGPSESPVGPGGDENQKAGLLYANNLIYTFPNDYSVCVNSTRKEQLFAQRSYKHKDTMICTLNTGADYIDPKRSYLQFDIDMSLDVETTVGVSPSTFDKASFGKGGTALNVIKEIFVQSRSGDDLYRIRNFNVMQHTAMKYTYPVAWWETIGANMSEPSFVTCDSNVMKNLGRDTNAELGKGVDYYVDQQSMRESMLVDNKSKQRWASGFKRINIPLYCLGGIFATDKLLPSSLCSGLNVRIQLEDARFATVWGKSAKHVNYDENLASTLGSSLSTPPVIGGSSDVDNIPDDFYTDLSELKRQLNKDRPDKDPKIDLAAYMSIYKDTSKSSTLTVYAVTDTTHQPLIVSDADVEGTQFVTGVFEAWRRKMMNRKWWVSVKGSAADLVPYEFLWKRGESIVKTMPKDTPWLNIGTNYTFPYDVLVIEFTFFSDDNVFRPGWNYFGKNYLTVGGYSEEWNTEKCPFDASLGYSWRNPLTYPGVNPMFQSGKQLDQVSILKNKKTGVSDTSWYEDISPTVDPTIEYVDTTNFSNPFEAHCMLSSTQVFNTYEVAYKGPHIDEFEKRAIVAKRTESDGKVSKEIKVSGPEHLADVPNIKSASYEIRNPKFIVHACQLTDAAQRALNEVSAMNGLEIVYYDYENTSSAPDTNKDVHIEVKKAVSRALKAIAVIRDEKLSSLAADPKYACITNSMACETFRVRQFYWQLGSLYFPHQRVDVDAHSGGNAALQTTAHSAYIEAVDAFGRFAPVGNYSQVKPLTFKGLSGDFVRMKDGNVVIPTTSDACLYGYADELQAGHDGAGILAVSLERSSLFKLSGVPINNSRVLMLHAHFDKLQNDDESKSRLIDIFLKYVKIARVFIHNVEVEE
jgi:hypothetical protein